MSDEEVLYTGATSVVAQVRADGRTIVRKRVAPGAPPGSLGQLRHEHDVLRSLASVPGVAQVIGWHPGPPSPGLDLEHYPWPTLAQARAAAGAPLPIDDALHLASALAAVLGSIHARDIVHKHLSPANLLVGADPARVVLIDFGIASQLSSEPSPDAGGRIEGTLAYVAPEQTGRTGHGVDARADLYALGVVLFELSTGRLPFDERSALALVHAHLALPPPPLLSLRTDAPPALAAIVARLLAKDPDRRYQSAAGLRHDLDECAGAWAVRRVSAPAVLGRRDVAARLRIPERLVGRDAELAAIQDAAQRVRQGERAVVAITGGSGTGKSALVAGAARTIAIREHGTFATGKYDQVGRTAPLGGLGDAFATLVEQHLARPEAELSRWRDLIAAAVGPTAAIVADVVTPLHRLLGSVPPVPPLPPERAMNRLRATWRAFARAVLDPASLTILFLDDLQWADDTTLAVLGDLAEESGGPLLIIAAFRDDAPAFQARTEAWLERVDRAGAAVTRLALAPLGPAETQAWAALALGLRGTRANEIGDALFACTRGNPFHMRQLIIEWSREGILRQTADGDWRWNPSELRRDAGSSDVVEVVRRAMRGLPEDTRRLLGLAACVGHLVSFGELRRITAWPEDRLVRSLWPALAAGLVLPRDPAYREVRALAALGGRETDATFAFLHDRVQQVCYEGLAVDERAGVHADIAARMLTRHAERPLSTPELLEAARHLRLGRAQLSHPARALTAARFLLDVARVTQRAASFPLMVELLDTAGALLAEVGAPRELRADVAVARIEAAYAVRDFAGAEQRARAFLDGGPEPARDLVVRELLCRTLATAGRWPELVSLNRVTLERRGVEVPADDDERCRALIVACAARAFGWAAAVARDEVALAPGTDEEQLIDGLLATTWIGAAFGGSPLLAGALVAQCLTRAMTSGRGTPLTAYAVASFAQVWAAATCEYVRAGALVEAALAVAERVPTPFLSELHAFRGLYRPYRAPAAEARVDYERAVAEGLVTGSFQSISWGTSLDLAYRIAWAGRPLAEVAREAELRLARMTALGDAGGLHLVQVLRGWATRLQRGPWAEGEAIFSPGSVELAAIDPYSAETARILETFVLLARGQHAEARRLADEAELHRATLFGAVQVIDIDWLRALAITRGAADGTWERLPAPDREVVARARDLLGAACAAAPANFEGRLHLLDAELARLQDDPRAARRAYDEAIEAAHREAVPYVEGLAARFAADHHRGARHERLAALYQRAADEAYARWGAASLGDAAPAGTARGRRDTRDPLGDREDLDLAATLQASQAIASELEPQRLLVRLVALALESAGATRAVLLLVRDGRLMVVARVQAGSEPVLGPDQGLSEVRDLPATVIQLAARMMSSLSVANPRDDLRFQRDPYVASHGGGAMLAIPLVHRSELRGVLYLENELLAAFSPRHVATLAALAGQAAVALENATLHSALAAAAAQLKRDNAELEAQVDERTRELRAVVRELWTEMDLATRIQTILLPGDGEINGLEVAGRMRPAARVGGDYFDCVAAGDATWVLAGDVSGHGVSAGLTMMMVHAAVRACLAGPAARALRPAGLLTQINQAIHGSLQQVDRGQYMTIVALRIEGDQCLYAGMHEPLVLVRAGSGQAEVVPTRGVWLGVTREIGGHLEDRALRLGPGDALLLHTDGLAHELSARRLELADTGVEALRAHVTAGAAADAIMQRLDGGELDDDASLVAIRVLGVQP